MMNGFCWKQKNGQSLLQLRAAAAAAAENRHITPNYFIVGFFSSDSVIFRIVRR